MSSSALAGVTAADAVVEIYVSNMQVIFDIYACAVKQMR